ncbi:uncharacterized protein LOC110904166 isoform X2 [Helianthus annuus]|uniref:uncharacterized protein LOC110904166 isoform X2 n=1 Tax=Helianthus annuus TaxID=4232 RepID=UPI00165329E2|nr:uncharacterized protein LOC110904166 isoform X2 [Helianthus annuus]
MADNTEHDNIDDSVVVVEKQVKLEVTSVCSEGREESDAGLKFLREIQIRTEEAVCTTNHPSERRNSTGDLFILSSNSHHICINFH